MKTYDSMYVTKIKYLLCFIMRYISFSPGNYTLYHPPQWSMEWSIKFTRSNISRAKLKKVWSMRGCLLFLATANEWTFAYILKYSNENTCIYAFSQYRIFFVIYYAIYFFFAGRQHIIPPSHWLMEWPQIYRYRRGCILWHSFPPWVTMSPSLG